MTTIEKPKCHSIIVTGKVQDIGFRSIVEHIGRSFGMPGTFIVGQHDHNTRLEAILEKLANR
jgi:acylphosphatase